MYINLHIKKHTNAQLHSVLAATCHWPTGSQSMFDDIWINRPNHMIRRIPANESFKTVAGWGAGSKIHLVLCKLGWPFIPRKKNRNLEGSRSFCRFHPILGAIDNMDPFHPACLEPNDPPVQLLGPDWLEVQLNPNRSWTTTRDYMDSRRFVIFCRSLFSSDVGWPRNKLYRWICMVGCSSAQSSSNHQPNWSSLIL